MTSMSLHVASLAGDNFEADTVSQLVALLEAEDITEPGDLALLATDGVINELGRELLTQCSEPMLEQLLLACLTGSRNQLASRMFTVERSAQRARTEEPSQPLPAVPC